VSRGATDEEIAAAFKKRQQRYHPDTLVGIDTGLVHEKIEELYVRIHDAYRTLVDPEAKAKYLEQIEGEMPGAPMAARSKSSRKSFVSGKEVDVMLFEEGFSLLRGGQYRRAHDLFTQALEQKYHPRYEAHKVWSAYLIDPQEKLNTARVLKELHKKNPDEALYPYLMGNLALREKDRTRAEALFERAVKIDPQHIDSARQLRILRMRSQTTEASGLFDLFRKK
jgi:tetratricopeptide (TPR) repeat protein